MPTASLTAKAITRQTVTGSLSARSWLNQGGVLNAQAAILANNFTFYSIVRTFRIRRVYARSIVRNTATATFSARALVSIGFTAQAIIQNTIPTPRDLYAWATVLAPATPANLTLNSHVLRVETGSLTVQAILQNTTTVGLPGQAIVKRIDLPGSLTARALTKVTVPASFTLQAWLWPSVKAQGIIKRTDLTGSATAQGIIKRVPSGSLTARGLVKTTQTTLLDLNALIVRYAVTQSWLLLATTQVTVAANNVDITAIPATFRHLRLVVAGRGDTSATSVIVKLTFNNDAGANYSYVSLSTTGDSGPTRASAYGATYLPLTLPAANATAGLAGSHSIDIPGYASLTFAKTVGALSNDWRALADGSAFTTTLTGLWNSTAQINRITLTPLSGNLAPGTVVSLYGLP